MNALELANALVNTDYTPLKAEAAGMLRQLQAEKEALAADCEALTNALARANRVYDFDNPFLDVDAIDRSARHVDKTANDRHDLTDEKGDSQFKERYICNFLSSYMASRYDSDCLNGHPIAGHQPVDDAKYLADEALRILKRARQA